MAIGGIPLGQWSGSDATRELQKTIEEFNKISNRQTTTIIRLTWIIASLTFLMLIGLVVQICLSK